MPTVVHKQSKRRETGGLMVPTGNIAQLLAQQKNAWHLKCRKRPQFDNKCLTTEVDVQQVLVRAQFIAAGRMIAGSTPLLQCVS